MKNLAIMIKTFLRVEPIFKLVESIEKYLPESHIYIADDSFEIVPEKKELYERLEKTGHTIIYPPADTGLSYGRNMLADIIKEDYVLYCDDDYVLTEGVLKVHDAVKILEEEKSVGLITGMLYQGGGELHYEHDLEIKDRTIYKMFTMSSFDSRGIRQVDLGLNFFVARRELFDKVRWDNRLIISTEHMDFFLQIKYKTDYKVMYFPAMTSLHCPPPKSDNYEQYRRRTFHWIDFADKWDVDEIEESGVRTNYRTEAWKWSVQFPIDNRFLFRDDDVSVDSDVDKLYEIQSIFCKHHKRELYMVTPFGNTTVLYDGYTHQMPLDELDAKLGKEPIENNERVIKFLKEAVSKGHQIGLHGYTHTRLVHQTNVIEEIRKAKEYLESILPVKIKYFSAPFNMYDETIKQAVEDLGMILLGPEGDQLEVCVRENKKLTEKVTWFHFWRFYRGELTPDKLDRYLESLGE